ncbi:MAG: ParA family protein [Defluviitaleaceae bacterium]|nr:ParA family protein [Defluviitaleaceae bacterium]
MKILCVINFKGGVAKTISAINIAHTLNTKHGKRVLLVDCDKQGNTSKFFGKHGYEGNSIADVLLSGDVENVLIRIKHTTPALDLIPANMNLLHADRQILIDASRPQQTRLKKAIQGLESLYDFAIIDCAPDLNMSVINALVATHDVLIPIKVDKFAFDGIDTLLEQIEEIKEFNPALRVVGGFVTMYARNNVNLQGVEALSEKAGLPMFETVIRKTVKVDETTYTGLPLAEYAPKCTAAKDYAALVDEYLQKGGGGIGEG